MRYSIVRCISVGSKDSNSSNITTVLLSLKSAEVSQHLGAKKKSTFSEVQWRRLNFTVLTPEVSADLQQIIQN